ncbi:hypothetical protein ACLB2K_068772 [Fragaria x ananassa]
MSSSDTDEDEVSANSLGHPVIRSDSLGKGTFVPNNITLGGTGHTSFILGWGWEVNSASPSLLGFDFSPGADVPAESFELSPVDRIFVRMGAKDHITVGQSTFLTELSETATMLLVYMAYFKPGELKEVIGCHHHKLKDVQIIGYRGITCAIQHVNYLIENAVALKKLLIILVQLRHLPPSVDRESELSKVEENATDHAKQHLVPKLNVSSTVEFVCL